MNSQCSGRFYDHRPVIRQILLTKNEQQWKTHQEHKLDIYDYALMEKFLNEQLSWPLIFKRNSSIANYQVMTLIRYVAYIDTQQEKKKGRMNVYIPLQGEGTQNSLSHMQRLEQ